MDSSRGSIYHRPKSSIFCRSFLCRRTLDLPPAGGLFLEDGVGNLVGFPGAFPAQGLFEDGLFDPSKTGLVLEPDRSVHPDPGKPQLAIDVNRNVGHGFPNGRKNRVGDKLFVVQSVVREFDGFRKGIDIRVVVILFFGRFFGSQPL